MGVGQRDHLPAIGCEPIQRTQDLCFEDVGDAEEEQSGQASTNSCGGVESGDAIKLSWIRWTAHVPVAA